jgi:putative FmdB family regulatory protein|tara:strand:+ start:719 stop:967 length:249 start_codon:yes stop_codon:yes gene_type:complete
MPIYEYYCEVCKSNFELIQKISDKPAKKCIKCNKSTKVIKLVSAPGFRLKGGGWYETDFKNGSKKNIHDSENKMTNTDKKEN